MTACRPTPPAPKIAIASPGRAFSTFITAPMPVGAAQPRRVATSSGSSGGACVSRFSLTTAWRWKVVTPPALTVRPFHP